jgi:hypothetical protein
MLRFDRMLLGSVNGLTDMLESAIPEVELPSSAPVVPADWLVSGLLSSTVTGVSLIGLLEQAASINAKNALAIKRLFIISLLYV